MVGKGGPEREYKRLQKSPLNSLIWGRSQARRVSLGLLTSVTSWNYYLDLEQNFHDGFLIEKIL